MNGEVLGELGRGAGRLALIIMLAEISEYGSALSYLQDVVGAVGEESGFRECGQSGDL